MSDKIKLLLDSGFVQTTLGTYTNKTKDRTISLELIEAISLENLQNWVNNNLEEFAYQLLS
jgi:uncharacterized protein YciI